MKKQLKIVNILLGITFLVMGISGVLHDVLISMGIYKMIHVPAAYSFLILACAHIWLNRAWIANTMKSKK